MSNWRMNSDISKDNNGKDILMNNNNNTYRALSSFEHMVSCSTIGDFIIGKQLGEGTFFKVFIGLHKLTNEKVAI